MNERKYVLKNRPPPILARKAGLPLFCPSFVIGTRPRRVRADISWKCPDQEAEGRSRSTLFRGLVGDRKSLP